MGERVWRFDDDGVGKELEQKGLGRDNVSQTAPSDLYPGQLASQHDPR